MSREPSRQPRILFLADRNILANQAHALLVRDFINQMKTSADPNYCVRVTADDGAIGDQHLRDFQDNEKTIPTILTTLQKLSTGVDARNVRYIVLLRLKYHDSIADAIANLGRPEDINQVFSGFQKYLYQSATY